MTFLPNHPVCFYTKNSQKVKFSSNCDNNTGHFIDLSPKKVILSSKCACIASTIMTFLPNNPKCVFTPKILKKFILPQIAPIIRGTLFTFLPKKVIFSSNCACISSTILTFLRNNPSWFYTKNSQKLIFSQIATIIQGTLTFLLRKVIFSSKCACKSSTILTCLPNNPVCFYNKNSPKVNFPQIAPIIQGTLLTFLPKKVIFSQNAPAYRTLFWLFCPINQYVFTQKFPKVNFPSNCAYETGHFIDFSPKKNDFLLRMRLYIEHYFDFFAH